MLLIVGKICVQTFSSFFQGKYFMCQSQLLLKTYVGGNTVVRSSSIAWGFCGSMSVVGRGRYQETVLFEERAWPIFGVSASS